MNLTWHKIPPPIFPPNNLLDIDIAGKTICLVQKGNEIHAVAHKCPHSGAIMSGGWVDAGGHLVCPLHKYRFDVMNGRNVTGEGYVLKRFPVEQREDGLYIGLEDQASPGF